MAGAEIASGPLGVLLTPIAELGVSVSVPAGRRAASFVRLLRAALGEPGLSQWTKLALSPRILIRSGSAAVVEVLLLIVLFLLAVADASSPLLLLGLELLELPVFILNILVLLLDPPIIHLSRSR